MKVSKLLLTALALTASTALSQAQDNEGGRGDRGDRGGRGGNPEEMRQRMTDMLKTRLKVSDEEWGVLSPLIEKVTTKQREAMTGRFGGGFGGRGGGPGGPGGGGNNSDRPGAAENTALRTALESESTSPEDLKAKLAALREVRKKGAADLAAARADLQKVVTVRQEAVLVQMGILE